MASLDKRAPAKAEGEIETSDDAALVTMMGMSLLDKGGLQTIQSALQTSQDPGQVVGQFLAQLIGQMAEFTRDSLQIDPAVYTEPNGFLDQILDYIERKLSLPKEFSDQVYGDALEVMKAAAMAEQNGGQPQQAAGGPPAGPAPGPGLDATGGPQRV